MAASARGLFAATGNAPKPKPQLQADGSFALTDSPDREKDDFNPTPPEPIRALLYAELRRIRDLGGVVWEGSAGDGALVREMEAVGLTVYATDMIDRGAPLDEVRDFYDFNEWPMGNPLIRITVQNPPFKEANIGDGKGRWIKHARQALGADYAAMLLPLSWCGPQGQSEVWDLDPPARVYVMRWRIDFTGEKGAPSNHCWYVWDGQTRIGETRFLMLDKWMDARQGELL